MPTVDLRSTQIPIKIVISKFAIRFVSAGQEKCDFVVGVDE